MNQLCPCDPFSESTIHEPLDPIRPDDTHTTSAAPTRGSGSAFRTMPTFSRAGWRATIAGVRGCFVCIHHAAGGRDLGKRVELPPRTAESVLLASDRTGELHVDIAIDSSARGGGVTVAAERDGHVIRALPSVWQVRVGDFELDAPRRLVAGDRVRVGHHLFAYLYGRDIERDFHELIYRLVDHDALTGLYNRRAFANAVEIARGGSVIELPLPGMEAVLQSEGPVAADDAIRAAAAELQSRLRGDEIAARVSVAVFAVHVPGGDLDARTAAFRAAIGLLH